MLWVVCFLLKHTYLHRKLELRAFAHLVRGAPPITLWATEFWLAKMRIFAKISSSMKLRTSFFGLSIKIESYVPSFDARSDAETELDRFPSKSRAFDQVRNLRHNSRDPEKPSRALTFSSLKFFKHSERSLKNKNKLWRNDIDKIQCSYYSAVT